MCACEGLRERDVGRGSGVYFDRRGAGCGENLGGCYGEREDIGDVSSMMLACGLGGGAA